MKVKFGDLTARQMSDICKANTDICKGQKCTSCPLVSIYASGPLCVPYGRPAFYDLEKEIIIPDKEEQK